MSLPSVAYPKSAFAFGEDIPSLGNRLEADLQEKRIKQIVLPILAVLGGFFLFPFNAAILFTAVVIFGVFICGNGPVDSSLPGEGLPFSNKPDGGNADLNPSRDIPSPVKPSGKTPQLHPATPVQEISTFRPTPTTVARMSENMPGLALIAYGSPFTVSRGLTQMHRDSSLETKHPGTLGKEGDRPVRGRGSDFATPRNLEKDFRRDHLEPVVEDSSD